MKVYVQGPYEMAEITMFAKHGYKRAKTIEDADIVCWTGGEDVGPSLYGEVPLQRTFFSPERDTADVKAFGESAGKFRVGICRGGQFLNVMSGGKLWQHVNNHGGRHQARDVETGCWYDVSSTHHQMMRPGVGGIVVAEARKSTFKQADGQTWDSMKVGNLATIANRILAQDVEAVWYPGTRALCFQPHPEYSGFEACTKYFFQLIDRYINQKEA